MAGVPLAAGPDRGRADPVRRGSPAAPRSPTTRTNGFIGTPLARRGTETRAAIADVFDRAALTAVWDAALAAPPWPHPPVWVHGDLHPGNLLLAAGQVSAVLGFGGLGVGDPACDALIARPLPPCARATFRAVSGLDDDIWTRGRGYALNTGLSAYTAYAATNPRVAASTRHQITETLANFQRA
nr:phosphotransferase [Amycolatopsis rubida]